MRAVGKNNAWFSFKGTRCDELGAQMAAMPVRFHPARRGELIEVPGVDGKLWLADNDGERPTYDRGLVSQRVIVLDNGNIDAVNAWLDGEGDLVFGDEPERAYHARISKQFTRNNKSARLRGQEFTVVFDCDPYRYEAQPTPRRRYNLSGSTINNPGTVRSLPLIKVELTNSEGTLMLGGETMLFSAYNGSIYLDCAAKIAYTDDERGRLMATQYVTGEWISIEPGEQFITWTGGINAVEITPRWRWL